MEEKSHSQNTSRSAKPTDSRRGGHIQPRIDATDENLLPNQSFSEITPTQALSAVRPDIQFEFGNRKVRSVMVDDEPWFVASDVCAVLGHSNPTKAVSRLDADERGLTTIQGASGDQAVNIISYSGLYALVLTSRKPEAKPFRRWITNEVIPSIRRTGGYQLNPDTATTRVVNVALPHAGRFIVTALQNGRLDIRQTPASEITQEATALDCQVLACALGSIDAFWQKVQQLRSIGSDPAGGFAFEQLERAIREGGHLGRHYLYLYDMRPKQAVN